MKAQPFFFLICLSLLISCNSETRLIKDLEQANKSIQHEFAPDKRVAIYDVWLSSKAGIITLLGETNSKKALLQFEDSIRKKKLTIFNKVRVLPDSAVGVYTRAVARNSVINIRSKPSHSAELGTQGLLGMPLKVFDKKGDFYRVQTPDKYISWVDKGGIQLMTESEFESWNQKPKIIFTNTTGTVYATAHNAAARISDIVFGSVLALESAVGQFYKVAYPDGRTGFVKKSEAVPYVAWLDKTQASSESIEKAARTLIGAPYLWGGTSTKGMDCSGFTKTVYLMNGLIIPRDASQQITAGKTVDKKLEFKDLEKGDLLFFGNKATATKKQRVTHVGIWLGNGKGEFIQSSGNVHISSTLEDQPNYDAFNKNRYLGSRRYLGVTDRLITDLKSAQHIKP